MTRMREAVASRHRGPFASSAKGAFVPEPHQDRLRLMVGRLELLQQSRDQGRPAGLMARAAPSARIPVKVLVEQNQVAPVIVGGKSRFVAVTRASTVFIWPEQAHESMRQLVR